MDTHPVSVAQPLPLAATDRTAWAEIITDWSIAGYKYTRAHERRWLPRVAATTLRWLALGPAQPTSDAADPTSPPCNT